MGYVKFLQKLRLVLIGAVMVFTILPTNFVFADNTCPEPLSPMDYTTIKLVKKVEKDIDDEFTFRIKAYECGKTPTRYYDFYEQFGSPVEDGTYEFTLKTNDHIEINMYGGPYEYEITEVENEDWKLVSVNGDEKIKTVKDRMVSEYQVDEYVFLNRKISEDNSMLEESTMLERPATDEIIKPKVFAPDTGESQASTSAVSTSIVAFSIIMVISRIVYLVRRYRSHS